MDSSSKILLPGEEELVKTLRDLVIPLRKQSETKEEQADCFLKLGKLYLQAGLNSKNGNDFTKASVLLNAAFARTSNGDVRKMIGEHLVKVKTDFLVTFYEFATPISAEDLEQTLLQNKTLLEKSRTLVKDSRSYRDLQDAMSKYYHNDENSFETEKLMVKEAKSISRLVQEEMLDLIKRLWQQALSYNNSSPPCRYSMMGLGSLARQEVTPYSDLEFAILVERQNDDVQEYFQTLTNLFHLLVLDLGETPVPSLAIFSLNDFLTPDGDWFYDRNTPSGFTLDGAMPWASKTPIGRQATRTKDPLSLIKTPKEMADLKRLDNKMGEAYHVSDVLSRTILIEGDKNLYDEFNKEVIKIVENSDPVTWNQMGPKKIIADIESADRKTISISHYDAKVIYRKPSLFIENMRIWWTPSYIDCSQWQVLENFCENQKLSREEAFNFELWIALAFAVRLVTYCTNRGQYEKIDMFELYANIQGKGDSVASLANNNVHDKLAALDSYLIEFLLSKLPVGVNTTQSEFKKGNARFPRSIERNSSQPTGYTVMFPQYFMLAVHCGDLPYIVNCGESCLRETANSLCENEPNLEALDFLLENTRRCACVAMIEIHLKIYKYCVLQELNKSTEQSGVNVEDVLDKLQNSTNLREQMFLNIGAIQMLTLTTDLNIVRRVVRHAEHLLNTFKKMPNKSVYKELFKGLSRFHFDRCLLQAYLRLDENEKVTEVCERCIDTLERTRTHKEIHLSHIDLYFLLAKAWSRIPKKQEEAVSLCERVIEILETNVTESPDLGLQTWQVFILVGVFFTNNRFTKAEKVIRKYFLNEDNKPKDCNSDHILRAYSMLSNCLNSKEDFEQMLLIFEKAYEFGKTAKFSALGLTDVERCDVAHIYLKACVKLKKFADLPKVAEFHWLISKAQTDDQKRSLEHKVFLLIAALELFSSQTEFLGLHILLRSLTFDRPCDRSQLVPSTLPANWMDILVLLCDALTDYCSAKGLDMFLFAYTRVPFKPISQGNDVKAFWLYMDYRFCSILCPWALDHNEHLQQAIIFYMVTMCLLERYFPKWTPARNEVEQAMTTCVAAFKDMSPNIETKPHHVLSYLIDQREDLYYKVKGNVP